MSYTHQRSDSGGRKELSFALVLTVAIMIVEFVAGWMSGSLALMADAGHMLTDSSALALSLFAAWFATRPATPEKTYGYYRTEILAALANGVALWIIVVWIYVRAFQRLFHPAEVETGLMLVVACLGLVTNLAIGRVLSKARVNNLNVHSAWLNVMSDALGSLGVIIAGCLIAWFGWTIADPIASMVIGVLIAITSLKLVRQSVNILLEGTPGHLQFPEVMEAMRAITGVHDVHDIHLWTITTGMDAMSGHVIVQDVAASTDTLKRLNDLLSQRFGITHTTIQIEPRDHTCVMAHPAGTAH